MVLSTILTTLWHQKIGLLISDDKETVLKKVTGEHHTNCSLDSL